MLEKIGYGISYPLTAVPAAPGAPTWLDADLASTLFEIDAGIEDSYPGTGQTVANLIAATGAAYDWWLGVDGGVNTSDPAFDTDHFSTDGGDYLTLKTLSGTMFENWHRPGTEPWWLAVAWRTAPSLSGVRALMGNTNQSAGQYGAVVYTPGTSLRFVTMNSANNTTSIDSAQTGDTDYLLVISADPGAGSDNLRAWQNSRTKTVFSHTFAADGGMSAIPPRILASAGSAGAVHLSGNGTRLYAAAGGYSQFLDDAEAGLIFDKWNARHGRTYA